MLPSELLTEPTRTSWNVGSLHWVKIVAFGWVLGRLGPRQSGPRQLGPWTVGPRTPGPQKYFEIMFLLVCVLNFFLHKMKSALS